MDVHDLPHLNAILNGTSAVLLSMGFAAIRRGKVATHKTCMLAALGVSTLFLISYLIYHARVGSVPFAGEGWTRPLYLSILVTHAILAATVPVLAIITVVLALRARIDAHRRIARFTLPIWLYVSVTGVVVYWMLYHLER